MTAAFEVSPDDPQQVAEAIARAAEGAVMHLVRDGRAVADIVPGSSRDTCKSGNQSILRNVTWCGIRAAEDGGAGLWLLSGRW
ncbi:MAG TPA: hypothetical protein VK784_00485 [Pseudonocardiaceae bacterium]|nr:hypothetical protein [Pseudonocardiaceae bacterium]